MRPTNGEIRKASASAAAEACGSAKEQGQIAVDAFRLKRPGGLDALPCRRDLDQDALAHDSALGVVGERARAPCEWSRRCRRRGRHLTSVETRPGTSFDSSPETDRKAVADGFRDSLRGSALLAAQAMASSTMAA